MRFRSHPSIHMAAVTLIALVLPHLASAGIPQIINYQGMITDSGSPVADGSYNMRFRIFDAVTSGNLEWDSGTISVSLAGGVFSVLLGESPQPAMTLDFDEDYWLLVTFAGTNQTPRHRLGSVGYAYMASGLVPGTEITGEVAYGPYAIIKGANTATTAVSYGIHGESDSMAGRGIFGVATRTSGINFGVWGRVRQPRAEASMALQLQIQADRMVCMDMVIRLRGMASMEQLPLPASAAMLML